MDDDDEIEIQDDPALRQFLPSGFGKQDRSADTAARIAQSKRKVIVEEKAIEDEADEDDKDKDADSDESSNDSNDEEDEFPVSHELVIKTHERSVTSATVDLSGGRLVTGSSDCTIKYYDFSSMTPTTIRAFRSVDPSASKTSQNNETHPIHQVQFNPISPSQVLVVSALPQAKIFSRDGESLATFVKGDMYLRDMRHTKGHISEVTSGAWHPTNPNLCVTAGTDSTLRIWDVNNPRTQKEVIVHTSRASGSAGRTRMTAVAWGAPADGSSNILISTALDGSLAMWSGEGPYNRPAAEILDAHQNDTWTSGLDISPDGRLIVTRGGDDTIKVWDARKLKQPVNTANFVSTASQYPSSNIQFSPSASNIITGSETGHLHILNPATLKAELVTPVTPGSPLITVLWHDKLNQIVTGSANAEAHVLYNPNTSNAGAKSVMSRAPKRRHIDDDPNMTMDLSQGITEDQIVTHSARHPNVGMTVSGRSRDPRRPHIPASTPFAKTQPDEKHIENIPGTSMRDEDPREALLKYADKAKDQIFTKAYKETQPSTIYGDVSDGEDEEAEPDKKRAKIN